MSKKLHTLINEFLEEKKIENGLTIPFIIGSFLFLENKQYNQQSIIECFERFFDKDRYFNLHFCDKIKELVISNIYLDDEDIYLTNKQIKKIENIISTDCSLDSYVTKQDLLENIERMYFENLKENCFSKEKGKWRNFEPTEIRIIKK